LLEENIIVSNLDTIVFYQSDQVLRAFFGLSCLGRVERTSPDTKLEEFIELVSNFTSCAA
jgi:hypothetical protein